MNINYVDLALSAQGYGDEPAFDYRAMKTGHMVEKPRNGKDFLKLLKNYSKEGMINNIKIFSHSYERGFLMENWSGFYSYEDSHDTFNARYIYELRKMILEKEITFTRENTISLFGCNLANENFALNLSKATTGYVIASEGGVSPQISLGSETGIFISAIQWKQYYNGEFLKNLGKNYIAW